MSARYYLHIIMLIGWHVGHGIRNIFVFIRRKMTHVTSSKSKPIISMMNDNVHVLRWVHIAPFHITRSTQPHSTRTHKIQPVQR